MRAGLEVMRMAIPKQMNGMAISKPPTYMPAKAPLRLGILNPNTGMQTIR